MSERDAEAETESDAETETDATTDTETKNEAKTDISEPVRNDSGGGAGATESDTGNGERETATAADVEALRGDVVAFAEEVEDRIVKRDALENDLKRYVRKRQRRGHARGWGPYLVLLYGTAMTIGAFALLSGGWAILAMLVVWLSTLGLYVVMVVVGLIGGALGIPGRLRDRVREFRS